MPLQVAGLKEATMAYQVKQGRLVHRLSERGIAKLIRNRGPKRKRYPDGNGLYLQVNAAPSKSVAWVWSVRHGEGKRSMVGLGSYPLMSLEAARRLHADKLRALRIDGVNPLTARSVPSVFRDFAERWIADNEAGWKSATYAQQWRSTLLGDYTKPIHDKALASIDVEDVLAILKPIWQTRPTAAKKLQERLEKILGAAKAAGFRSGDNSAQWRGHLEHLLPAPGQGKNRKAMPYSDVPDFVAALRERRGDGADALELLVLTASRTAEVLGARVAEFDLTARTWIRPAERMKNGKEHSVPLSDRAAAIVAAAIDGKGSDEFLFANARGKRLDDSALRALLARMGVAYDVHGFRSSFRDWAGNETNFPREIAEHALAHTIGNKAEQSYRRSDALERRRPLMERWARFMVALKRRKS